MLPSREDKAGSVIVAAWSLGAGAFTQGWLGEAKKETYKTRNEAVLRIVLPGGVEKLA